MIERKKNDAVWNIVPSGIAPFKLLNATEIKIVNLSANLTILQLYFLLKTHVSNFMHSWDKIAHLFFL